MIQPFRDRIAILGYGSLIFKADFPFLERRPASIEGWARRFWQGSHDHRGTPERPGRVLTLCYNKSCGCVFTSHAWWHVCTLLSVLVLTVGREVAIARTPELRA